MKKISCILITLLWGLSGQVFAMTGMQIDYTQAATGGTVSAVLKTGATADYILTATPTAGYRFLYWVDANGTTNTDNPRTITHGLNNTDETYNAVFVKIEDVDFEGGLVAVTPSTYTPASMAYSLLAKAGSCGEFAEWNNESEDNPIAYTSVDGTRKPTFTIPNDLLIKHEDGVGGTIEVTTLNCGFTLKAVANTDYKFVAWGDDAKEFGSTEVIDVDYLDNKDYSAGFTYAPTVAKRGTKNFETVQAAIDADGDESVVLVLDAVGENVIVSKAVTIDGQDHKIGNLTIDLGGDVTLTSSLDVQQLLLKSTTGASSQLRGESYLKYASAAIDITLMEAPINDKLWFAFGVPFPVTIPNGIRRASSPTGTTKVGTDFYFTEYDGQMRATNNDGKGWKLKNSGTLTPGNFYMISVAGPENTWRFISDNNSTLSSTTSIDMPAYSGSKENGGWNAMANSTFAYATASTTNGVKVGQVYENGAAETNYITKKFSDNSFVVGTPFFIQVGAADQLQLDNDDIHSSLYAPTRQSGVQKEEYNLYLMKDNQQVDVVYLFASEDAQNTYQMGRDVIKISTSSTYPRLYTSAYGFDLCAEDAPLVDEGASYQLVISSPEDCQYELALQYTTDDVTLWNGNVQVWDFIFGNYKLDMTKGVSYDYTLRTKKIHMLPTELDNVSDSQSAIYKYLKNGQLYIRVGEKRFNVQGAEIR